MIDTIVIKLHHVSKYPVTKTKFEAKSKRTVTTGEVEENEIKTKSGVKVSALMYHDTDTVIPLTKRDSFFIPSSHYLLSYFYNVRHDTIEFNFSIPKYLYSTNIFQFVLYASQSPQDVWLLFEEFLQEFILLQFPEKIELDDIEINRIDLCYNQFFASKLDALRYLDAQKELLVKYARSSKNRYKSYDTSFMYVTDRYSFKVYHKGAEFDKHDKRQLSKNNPKGYNIADLQDKADLILRYEVTFRKSQINYLFKQANFHNDYLEFEVENRDAYEWFRVVDPVQHEYSLQFVDRSKTFLFDIVNHDPIINYTARFDYHVFKLCFDFFWSYVRKFQLQPKLSILDIQKNIDESNFVTEYKNKLRAKQESSKEKTRLTMLALVAQTYPLEEIKKMGIIPERTYYKYQKELKEIGVVTENRLPYSMVAPALDYSDYKYYFGRYHLK